MVSDKNQYRKAAKRHLDTCRYMLDHLDKIKSADDKYNNILMDVYYLSGYVIECASTFGMLSLGQEITKIGDNGRKYIPHEMKKFIVILDRECPNLNLRGRLIDRSPVKNYYTEWETEVRYKEKGLDVEKVKKFVTLSEGIYNHIMEKIEGN